ncbi:hypothetical protein BDD12DRAFT_439899 [Trichophaea hybrida]|nr:hypothetical protein BDD12DRAFT_439899 [Trichophaea hybrida]
MSPFLYNLLLFSPLLLIAAIFIYVLDRLDTQRRTPPPEPPEEQEQAEEQTQTPDAEDVPTAEPPTDLIDSESEPESDSDTSAGAPPPTDAIPTPQLRTPQTRHIGPKKMRSLARRDQRRAYHEFLRSQAEARSQVEATLLEEETERAFENARRRYLLEEEIASRREAERTARLEEERVKKAVEAQAVQAVVGELWGKTVVRLDELAGNVGRGREWVESVVKREGFLGVGEGGEVRMVTREGVWVSLHPEAAAKFWRVVEEKGKLEWGEVGEILEGLLMAD